MNKLADEQNAPEASQDQPATDFYARITPESVSDAFDASSNAHWAMANRMFWDRLWKRHSTEVLIAGLLYMLEQAERRAEELQDELAAVYALLPGYHYMDPPDGGDVSPLEQMRRLAEDAKAHRETIANGNISEDWETLARGDMPPGGAA